MRFELEELIENGDTVVVIGTVHAHARGSGIDLAQPSFNVT